MSKKYKEKVLSLANNIIRIIGCLIFIPLMYYVFRYTQFILPGGAEKPVTIKDSELANMVVGVAVPVLIWGLMYFEKKCSQKMQRYVKHILLVVAMLWIGLLGMWWIGAVDRVPEGDQAFVYGGASYFLEGQYSFLGKGGYCSMFPYQLGLIALIEVLFLFVGPLNYYACQVICVLLTVGIVYLGFRIVEAVTEHSAIVVAYCLLMMCCLPMVFYTGWVYGDVPSIFFALLIAYMLLLYSKAGKKRYLAGVIFSATMAMLVRKHSLILLIALGLVAVVYAFYKKDKKIVLAVLIAVILPSLVYEGIYKMYEIRTGHERYDEIPMLSGIALGMQERDGVCGWYYDYAKKIFYANDCNAEVSTIAYKNDIKSRLQIFLDNPKYTRGFYKEKILSQWNEPLYQSLYFSNKLGDSSCLPAPDSFVAKLSKEYFSKVLWFCDRLHFVIYMGLVCYLLFGVKSKSNILQHVLVVTMIGGFLFSIIWEAKARYILPYYITMFPYAVLGFEQLLSRCMAMFHKIADKNREEDEKPVVLKKGA